MGYAALVWSQLMVFVLMLDATLITASTTETPDPTPGPDDLVLVDYIIIGVTAGVGAVAIIGGIVYACIQCCKSKAEDELEDRLREKKSKSKTDMGDVNRAYEEIPTTDRR